MSDGEGAPVERVSTPELAAARESAQLRVTRALAEAADLQEVAPKVLRAMCEGLGFDIGELWLPDEADTNLVCVARHGELSDVATIDRLAVDSGLPALVLEKGTPVISNDLPEDPRFVRREVAASAGLRRALGVPVPTRGRNVGAVLLLGGEGDGDVSRRSVEIAADIALQLGHFIERREAEANLDAQAARLKAIFDVAAEGILVAAPNGEFVLENPAAKEILGEPLHGKSLEDFEGRMFDPKGAPLSADEVPLARALRGESTTHFPLDVRRSEGELVHLSVSGRPLPDGSAVVIFADQSVRGRAEKALRSAYKLEAIARLAGGIAHDFNNYLTVITSYVHLLSSTFETEDPRREDVDEILSAVSRASRLTRQLLAFGGRQVLMPRAVDINEVVTGLEILLRRLVGEQAHFQVVSAPSPAVVLADDAQLEQVVVNLVVNARDATASGGVIKLGVELLDAKGDSIETPDGERTLEGSWARLFVTDTGVGIPDDIAERMFEPFFTTKEAGKGTGLGLATVYGIVAQSGGYLTVDTEIGVGTCFSIYLPVEKDAERDAGAQISEPPAHLRGTETVLLVEDDDAVRKVTSRALRGRGYTVLEASGAGEALLFLERHAGPIDLLLTDIVMPLMSGLELGERVAERWPDLHVLFMTGYAGDGEIDLPAGTRVLAKPFALDDLARTVRETLDQPR